VFVAVIGGASALWWVHQAKTNEQKLAEEARVCRVRAEQGDARAQSDLGNMYYYGRGVPQDYAEALRWYRKSADQGNANAQKNVGIMYQEGHSVPQNYAEAISWYHKAAEQDYARAQSDLGNMYFYGRGAPQDCAEALRWYHKSADQGDANAQSNIGIMYQEGHCVPQDYAEAARWYRKAADQGYASAQYNLGNMYYYGRGVPQDRADAIRWFRKAADQGDMYAQRSISYKLTASRLVLLWSQVILCLWLSLGFLLPNSFKPSRGLRDVRQSVISGTGALGLFSAGLDWYGYTHYKIRCLNCGWNAFTWFYWLLDGVLLVFLICIAYILPAKKPGEEQVAIGAEETETVSEGKNNG